MAKYRSKPVEVEAERVSDLLELAEKEWENLPEWIKEEYEKGHLQFACDSIHIKSVIIAFRNDWIINQYGSVAL